MTPSRTNRSTGVHAHIEALGLRTYNRDHHVTRAIFKFQPVIRLYKLEVPHYFGILCRDGGTVLSREDPTLLDKELDQLLEEYGPVVWPQPQGRNREHLRDAKVGTLYESDLIYPRDASTLKNRLRALILAKRLKPGTNIQALIEKRHKDSRMKVLRPASNTAPSTPINTRAVGSNERQVAHSMPPCHYPFLNGEDHSESESEDSVMGTTKRRRAVVGTNNTCAGFSNVELRLYRKTSTELPDAYGPVKAYGPWFLTPDCLTAHECFTRICDKIETDCSFMTFRFPEDMSMDGSLRLNRGSGDAEPTFQRVLDILHKAKKFPGEPRYRSVEVEVGLELPSDEQ